MRRLRVDLNSGAGDVVFTNPRGEQFELGEMVTIYDLDTDTFAAEVIDFSPSNVTLRVGHRLGPA